MLEGVNLPADNLFITSNKNGGDMNSVDFRNLMGRVGRIEFNLYGNIFLVCIKYRTNKKKYLELLQEEVQPQQLSVVTALDDIQKQQIVSTLKEGKSEIPKLEWQDDNDYSLMRKFANILLRDIVNERDSRVHQEFKSLLSKEDEHLIADNFTKKDNAPDDDINLSPDQTERLADEIRSGLHYPIIRIGGRANYSELLEFLERLCEIFKWDVYEKDTLGFFNPQTQKFSKLAHYAFVLNQWVSGMGLNTMILDAIENDTNNPKAKVRINGQWVQFQPIPEHINFLIGNLLEDIDNVILFRLANYFLRFSQEYKRIHPDEKFMDWYEFVEYGCTNPFTIWLQRNGFTREAATYIRNNFQLYFATGEDGQYRLRLSLLECENLSVRKEARQVYYNGREIFM